MEYRNIFRATLGLALAVTLFAPAPAAALDAGGYAVLVDEHVDIAVNVAGGEFEWGIHDGDADVGHEPSGALLYVGPGADPDGYNPGLAGGRKLRSEGAQWDFIGVAAGEVYWLLPRGHDPSTLHLGFAAEDTAWNALDSYDAAVESGGRVRGPAPWIRVRLVRVEGPGDVSVWHTDGATPVVFISSADGLDPSDSLWILAGGHLHYNLAFTRKGLYRVTFEASARAGGQAIVSEEATYTFGVEASGDMDGDRVVDLTDITAMMRVAGGLEDPAPAGPGHDARAHGDSNGDGVIDLADAVTILRLSGAGS